MSTRGKTKTTKREPFLIAQHLVPAGTRSKLELPISRLMSGTLIALPVIVVHGIGEGPAIWLTAAVHGDELAGVEIIRRVLEEIDPRKISGTVIAVPIVNVHGFNNGVRYLPDRRDLNRSFPGSPNGSLGARIAHLLMTEVISRCSAGIDLHTGSDHRINLPQIRADLDDPLTLELAKVFAAPIAIHSRTRDGSLRQAATTRGTSVLLYEAGEADRFDRQAIHTGTEGVLRVLEHLKIRPNAPIASTHTNFSRKTKWVRAARSGILHLHPVLGQRVTKGETVASVFDPFGKRLGTLSASIAGAVICHTQRPLVNRGDAVLHIAELEGPEAEPS